MVIPTACLQCARPATLTCGQCRAVRYCTLTCAQTAWQSGDDGHRHYCHPRIAGHNKVGAAFVSAPRLPQALEIVRELRAAWIAADGDTNMDVDDNDNMDVDESEGGGEDRPRVPKRPREAGRGGEEDEDEPPAQRQRREEEATDILGTILSALFDEVTIGEIFRRLTPKELLAIRQINSTWYKNALAAIRTVDRDLVLHISDDMLRQMPNVTYLDVSEWHHLTDAGLQHLRNLKTLIVDGDHPAITSEVLLKLTSLTELSIPYDGIRTNGSELRYLPRLRTLRAIENSHLEKENVRQLTQLTALYLGGARKEMDNDFVASLTDLESFGPTADMNGHAIEGMSRLSTLHMYINEEFLLHPEDVVAYAPGLSHLIIEPDFFKVLWYESWNTDFDPWFGTSSDVPISILGELPKLSELTLDFNGTYPSLDFPEDPVTIGRLTHMVRILLPALSKLRILRIRKWEFFGETGEMSFMPTVATLNHLEHLALEDVRMTPKTFVDIGTMPHLRILELDGTFGFEHHFTMSYYFMRFTAPLEELVFGSRFSGNFMLDTVTVTALKQYFPKLRVVKHLYKK